MMEQQDEERKCGRNTFTQTHKRKRTNDSTTNSVSAISLFFSILLFGLMFFCFFAYFVWEIFRLNVILEQDGLRLCFNVSSNAKHPLDPPMRVD